MNQFLTKYIELKQAFEITDCSPTSVRDLYDFREQLSHIDDLQAKMVLVDVLNLLWFKKSAYELYRSILDKKDPTTFKRLAKLKTDADNCGDFYAIPQKKTPEEEAQDRANLISLSLLQIPSQSIGDPFLRVFRYWSGVCMLWENYKDLLRRALLLH